MQVKYPDPSLYNCKHKREDRLIEHLQAKFKVEPMSRFYYPEWDKTTVTAGSSKQSTEPHSKKDDRLGTKYAAKLPAKSFTLKKYGKYGQSLLSGLHLQTVEIKQVRLLLVQKSQWIQVIIKRLL